MDSEGPFYTWQERLHIKNQLFCHVRLTWCEKCIQNTCKPLTCEIAFAFAFRQCEQAITCYVSYALRCHVKLSVRPEFSIHLLPSLTLMLNIGYVSNENKTKMYVCTFEEFILVEIWIHCCTKLNS